MRIGKQNVEIKTDPKWKLTCDKNGRLTWVAGIDDYQVTVSVTWDDNLMHTGLEYQLSVSRLAPVETGGVTEDYKSHDTYDTVEALKYKIEDWVSNPPERAVVHIHMMRDSA